MSRLQLVILVWQLSAALGGYFAAASFDVRWTFSLLTLLAIACLVIGVIQAWRAESPNLPKHVRYWTGCLLAYSIVVVLCEPYLWDFSPEQLLIGCVLLVPWLIGISELIRRHAWFASIGCVLLVWTSCAIMRTNVAMHYRGYGFFERWVS